MQSFKPLIGPLSLLLLLAIAPGRASAEESTSAPGATVTAPVDRPFAASAQVGLLAPAGLAAVELQYRAHPNMALSASAGFADGLAAGGSVHVRQARGRLAAGGAAGLFWWPGLEQGDGNDTVTLAAYGFLELHGASSPLFLRGSLGLQFELNHVDNDDDSLGNLYEGLPWPIISVAVGVNFGG